MFLVEPLRLESLQFKYQVPPSGKIQLEWSKIYSVAIDSTDIVEGAVFDAHISSVTWGKIREVDIIAEDLSDGSVTTAKLANYYNRINIML